MLKNVLKILFYPFRQLFSIILALILLFEEWGWEPLQQGMVVLGRWLRLKRLGELLQQLPPYAALVSLALPSLILIPFKLLAFALIAKGQAVLGACVFITAKIIGTAVIARIFSLVRNQLMQIAWFAKIYTWWKAWKDSLLTKVRGSWAWQSAKAWRIEIQTRLKFWLAKFKG